MECIPAQLKPLNLHNVVETGKKLGSGTYGEVVEVSLSGLKCAGKKLHAMFSSSLHSSSNERFVSRFVEECVRYLSGLSEGLFSVRMWSTRSLFLTI